INTKKLSLPKKTRKFKRLPTPEEVIEAVRGTDIELPVLMGMWLGMRISEILGARKSDIDGNILTINQVIVTVDKKEVVKQTAKTYNSNRQLRLPKYILDLIDNTDGDRLVPETRSSVYHKFKRKMHTIGYDISFHDLRHVNASVMAFLDIPDIYAMERGGWSNTATLKGVYQQTFDNERISVDNKIDDYFATKLATKNAEQRKIEA
ncbi:MAG: site-specific integrase, partial [Oscillospiraceae bacterium]